MTVHIPMRVQKAQTPRGAVEYVMTGDGPAVLALHGAMGGWDQSLLLARTIAEPGYTIVALSRPGYLGTALATGRAPEEQADLYAETLDALGVTQVAVMAVSGGGPSAIHFALRYPNRCWGLVLVSTCGTKVHGRLPLSFHLLKLLGRWPWFTAATRRRMERDPEQGARASIPDPELRARTLSDPEAGPLFRELLSSTSDRMALRLAGTANDVEVTRTREYPLEQIRVPVLVVHGTVDRMVPFERHGMALANRIPRAELFAAEGGDHVSIFTHRHVVQPRVVRFLRDHAPRAATHEPLAAPCAVAL
jgi:pimeloyl-ACP methyl ester carboxylesterase